MNKGITTPPHLRKKFHKMTWGVGVLGNWSLPTTQEYPPGESHLDDGRRVAELGGLSPILN